jgi:acetoin utilization deacetylase AcuC-like enzyme
MNIIFHDDFYKEYDYDPAAAPGRMEPIIRELRKHPHYKFITPVPADEEDLLRAHSAAHIASIRESAVIYDMAILAAGGAIMAAELAFASEPSFGCIRPPGHHASADGCWGFCFFNNMAVINILGGQKGFKILTPGSLTEKDYLCEIESILEKSGDCDIIAASAGFDEYVKDWGGKLSTLAYQEIGRMIKDFSEKHCGGRRYALLEGGYCYEDLGFNVHAFCDGFR